MTKHRHYDMIVAQAANTDLVKMYKNSETNEWSRCVNQGTLFNAECDYFLCLPRHEKACLHFLNRGSVVITDEAGGSLTLRLFCEPEWHEGCLWIHSSLTIVPKPKKVKRWIAYNSTTGSTYGTFDTEEVCAGYHPEHQHIEIEVEV